MFTYGATCSGKTFTIQGETDNPGILPRALDVLFNTISDRLLKTPDAILNEISGRDNDVFSIEHTKGDYQESYQLDGR